MTQRAKGYTNKYKVIKKLKRKGGREGLNKQNNKIKQNILN